MDLTKITNKEMNDLKLNETEFNDIKTFIINKDKDILPPDNVELNNSINSMLNRWQVPEGSKRDKIKKLCVKLYYGRLNDKKSRIFWRVLKENIDDLPKK